jgi:hypothetical protein
MPNALPSEGKGQGFESLRVRHFLPSQIRSWRGIGAEFLRGFPWFVLWLRAQITRMWVA